MSEATRAEKLAVVEKLLETMNAICETGVPMTPEQGEALFTDDCRMTLNGQLLCQGRHNLVLHGRDIQKKLKKWHFNMPFERTVVEGEDVFVYYTCDTLAHDGAQGRVYDMCIYSVRGGRIRDICEVVHFGGHQIDLESFT
ncbi:MAG: hypothetical protein AB7V46_06150 [Thermomicrobiales bacterium]